MRLSSTDTIAIYSSLASIAADLYIQTPEERKKSIETILRFLCLLVSSSKSDLTAIFKDAEKINNAYAVAELHDIIGLDTPDNEMVIIDPDNYEERH